MNDDGMKMVQFNQYCATCQYHTVDGADEPCNECLHEAMNYNSHKPVKYEAQ